MVRNFTYRRFTRFYVFPFFLYLTNCWCYVINISTESKPGTVIFNASFNSLRADRRYKLSPYQNAPFVYDMFHVNENSGKVVLKRYVNCDGILYPRIFTLYIESMPTCLQSINYCSLPLRIFINGVNCHDQRLVSTERKDYQSKYLRINQQLNSQFSKFMNHENIVINVNLTRLVLFHKALLMKNWMSQTIASYEIYTDDNIEEICFKKSQFLSNLENFMPETVTNACKIRFLSISDSRFRIELKNYDIVAKSNICVNEKIFKVLVTLEFSCSEMYGTKLNHQIGIIYRQHKLNNTDLASRVRRELTNQSPFFEQNLFTGYVLEESIPGEVVITIQAHDPENSPLLYHMTSILDSRSQSFFTIDPHTGVVTTTTSLDREEMHVHYFQITASDESFLPRSATTTLQINVEDINDNYPLFEKDNMNATIWEGSLIGTAVITVRASDYDSGKNAEIEYIIEYITDVGHHNERDVTEFEVNPKTGIISTNAVLDREEADIYTIFVVAQDSPIVSYNRKSTTATVFVKVLDENDNYPQFEERVYSVQIKEDEKYNNIIAHIKASDADDGNNAAIRYAIISGNTQAHFSIDSVSGEVTLIKQLDYEIIQSFRLVVRAQDGGSPSRSNTTQLLVQVIDVNDNSPKFYVTQFQESVLESVPTGYNVIRVQAYDPDHGLNAEIQYSLRDNDEHFPFIVNDKTGWIHTKWQLDRENCSRFTFQVIATDRGDPPLSASANVIIIVQDVNDNDPSFQTKYYEVTIREDIPPGSSVLTVSATDPDENSRLHYDIISGNYRNRFAINIQNGKGIITVAQPLDYKQEFHFLLTITATDLGGRLDTAYVNVNITDVNNFAPVFENSPYSTVVMEDIPIGTTVIIVSAIDNDSGINAQITYILEDSKNSYVHKYPFAVHPKTGAITTIHPLDREQSSSYLLAVRAVDAGIPSLSDTTDVEIVVSDVNDNAPRFETSEYRVSISEDATIGSYVMQVCAQDIDTGSNGQVTYLLDDENIIEGSFIIDYLSGTIRTNKILDRESCSEHVVVVIAKDKGTPPQSASINVVIKLEDINDSAPSFSTDKIIMHIQENSPIGSTVGTIEAKDPDEGVNAIIQYSIVGGIDSNLFALVPNVESNFADIITMTPIDFESPKKRFELIIRAASPPLRNDVHVEILVIDVNDNVPILKNFNIICNNYQDHFPVGEIGRIPAYDADISDRLKFKVFSGNNANFININESTGGITLSPQLNTNVQRSVVMGVFVTDGINEITSTMQLIVRLITEEILSNSVTLTLSEISVEAFLSAMYNVFVNSVAVVIPCPQENIIVFSIQEDHETIGEKIALTFSVVIPNLHKENFFSIEYLQERIHLHRATLSKIAGIEILPFEDNVCVREPCLNFEQCTTVFKYGNASTFISSDTLLFRPIHPVKHFACHCPLGFVGGVEHYLCDREIDLCYSNPCHNNGSCFELEGGYSCTCGREFTGKNCEKKIDVKLCANDTCNLCSSIEDVTDLHLQDRTRICGLKSRSFGQNSFITFSSLKSRYRFNIKLKFATLESNALLFYNGRYNELHDFIALSIIDGRVSFSFSLGGTEQVVNVYQSTLISDGMWHIVEVSYHNRTATVTVDDCDKILGLKMNLNNEFNCVNQSTLLLAEKCSSLTAPCYRFLDLTGPFHLGGISMRPKHFPFGVNEFLGCISDFSIDNQLIDMNSFLSENGTTVGCSQKASHCNSEPCLNGGICLNGWNRHLCVCPQEYTGYRCQETTSSPWRFSNGSFLNFNPVLRPIQFPWNFGLSIRTLQENSSLFQIQIGQNSSLILSLGNGILHLCYKSDCIRLQSFSLSDGNWHRIDVYFIDSHVKFSIDYDQRMSFHTFHKNIQGQYIGKIRMGIFDYTLLNLGNFSDYNGCIQDVRVSGVQNIRNMPLVSEKLEDGCTSKAECLKACPMNSFCAKRWDEAYCMCQKGYIGSNCTSVCALHPCHSGNCHLDNQLPKFYRCECNGTSAYGEYCEHSLELPCPTGWWGEKICGPCKCDIHKGYNPDCNKKTGQCYCKDYHFQPFNSSGCLPCNCYSIGSLGSTCDVLTGQCVCREGVIGRRCDSCTNNYAEVTVSGCVVVYDACPRSYSNGIWWERTGLGKVAVQDCPSKAKGVALRKCDEVTGRWSGANLFNCTSKPFLELKKKLERIENGQLELNSFLSIKLVRNLKKACEAVSELKVMDSYMTDQTDFVHRNLYGIDVFVIDKLLHYIIKFECTLHGLNLSHSQDKNFVDNIVFIASIILSDTYESIWDHIQRITLRGPENLLELFEDYMKILGESHYDIFSTPFEVVHENMVLGMDVIPINVSTSHAAINLRSPAIRKEGYEGKNINFYPTSRNPQPFKGQSLFTTIPKYDNYMQDKTKFDKYTKVLLPISLLEINAASGTSSEPFDYRIVVVYSQYKDSSIFPKRYDETISRSEDIRIASTIFTLQILKAFNQKRLLLDEQTQFPEVGVKKKVDSIKYVEESPYAIIDKNFINRSISEFMYEPMQSGILNYPIIIQIMINAIESKFLSKLNPQCIRWSQVSKSWTRIGCHTDSPSYETLKDKKYIFINCTCNQGSTYSVLVDVINIDENFEITKTQFGVWSSYILSLFMLAIVFISLSLLEGGESNSIYIRRYIVVSTFSAELFFFIGIQTQEALWHKSFLCKFLGTTMHYFWLSAFVWKTLDCFHLYRMLTEMRDINHGPMRFYIAAGFGAPAVIVCVAVGLQTYEYGNSLFCWLPLYEPLAWCLFGPICALACICLFLLFMCIKSAFKLKGHISGCGDLRNLLFQSVITLPLITTTWILSVLSTYKSSEMFIRMLCCAVLLTSTFLLITNCINAQTRGNLYLRYLQCLRKNVPVVDSLHTTHSFEKGIAKKSLYSHPLKHNIGISTSSTTSRSTGKTNSSFRRSDIHLSFTPMNILEHVSDNHSFLQAQRVSKLNTLQQKEQRILSVDTDSPILELASSHSSDDDEPRILDQFKHEISSTNKLQDLSTEFPIISTRTNFENFSLRTTTRKTVLPLHGNEVHLHGLGESIRRYGNIVQNAGDTTILPCDESEEMQNNICKPCNANLCLESRFLNDELGTTMKVHNTERKSVSGYTGSMQTSSSLEMKNDLSRPFINRNFGFGNDLLKQEEEFDTMPKRDSKVRKAFSRDSEYVYPNDIEEDKTDAGFLIIPSINNRMGKVVIKEDAKENFSVSLDTHMDAPILSDSRHQVEETIV